ncbi:MAG: glycosyltransferase family 2 protein [Thiobacillus sp.]
MTSARITILIPNYNRPFALARLLKSVFHSIEFASANDLVKVLVVDDYSDEEISSAVAPYNGLSNFTFKLQASKCGNAELAFLSALESVETEYTWLLGNDDVVFVEGVKCVLDILASSVVGFVLLNPCITKTTIKRNFVPVRASSTSVDYEKAEDLFFDFGFVTSTTTFPCLIMKTDPVRNFHRTHQLTAHATVYSHTFTIFGALREQRALFLSTPIINFTLNERLDEHRKLVKQSPEGIMFYHQSLGLARLIRACSSITGVPIERIGASCEDEINKDTMYVVPTHLSHFILYFFIEQLCHEQHNVQMPRAGFGYLSRSEIKEISAVIEQFADDSLSRICVHVINVFNRDASPESKIHFLRSAQKRLKKLTTDKYMGASKRSDVLRPKKMAMPNIVLASLRGSSGGFCGNGLSNI